MRTNRRGFTLIEIMVVIVLGAALTQMAVKAFGPVSDRLSAREARNVFQSMAARARAEAIESGMPTMLVADANGDSLLIVSNGNIVENVRVREEMGVDIQAASGVTRICMTPRGYANPTCNSFTTPIDISFVRGVGSESLQVLPMGQIR